MSKIESFCSIVQLISVVLLIIGFMLLLGMGNQGITFIIGGGSLLLVMLVLKRIINQTYEEFQDLKDEIHSLHKELEALKKCFF